MTLLFVFLFPRLVRLPARLSGFGGGPEETCTVEERAGLSTRAVLAVLLRCPLVLFLQSYWDVRGSVTVGATSRLILCPHLTMSSVPQFLVHLWTANVCGCPVAPSCCRLEQERPSCYGGSPAITACPSAWQSEGDARMSAEYRCTKHQHHGGTFKLYK